MYDRLAHAIWIFRSITYEFGDQRDRIWLAQNDEGHAPGYKSICGRFKIAISSDSKPITEKKKIRELFEARQQGRSVWKNFCPSAGSRYRPLRAVEIARKELGLDEQPDGLIGDQRAGRQPDPGA